MLCCFQPERIDPPDPTKPDYDIRADVWSLGISLVSSESSIQAVPEQGTRVDDGFLDTGADQQACSRYI